MKLMIFQNLPQMGTRLQEQAEIKLFCSNYMAFEYASALIYMFCRRNRNTVSVTINIWWRTAIDSRYQSTTCNHNNKTSATVSIDSVVACESVYTLWT